MVNGRSQRAFSVHPPHLCRGTDGEICRRERTGPQVGKKTQKQSLARRNGDGPMCGGSHGNEDHSKGDTNATDTTSTKDTSTESIYSTSGRVVEGTPAVAKRYTPPGCPMCQAVRPKGNYTDVYCTRGKIRYCRCRFCGTTFSDTE